MSWYYSVNNESRGPVAAAELISIVASGAITSDSLVWREGLAEWVPLSKVRAELGAMPEIPTATGSNSGVASNQAQRCVECGFLFPRAELLSLEGTLVCARCKPVFLQKMREGVPVGGANGVWRRGREMVVALEATLPERCVKCNVEAKGQRLKRALFWHHPALYIMILFPGLLIYALVAICVRKKATLHVALCDAHRSQRRWAIFTSWAGIFLGIGAFFLAGSLQGDNVAWAILSGIVLILASAIYGVVRSRVVVAKKIDERHAYVGGICPAFLQELPEFPSV